MSLAQIRTLAVDGSRPRFLGAAGPVGGLVYSFTIPGGCDALTCTLQVDPRTRTDALDPGRIVQAIGGADVLWEGTLDEPQQSDGGWSISAHGSGTWGADYTAQFGTWGTDVPDTAINNAIGRGLGWHTSTIGQPAGLWLQQAPDTGSVMIDEMLNQVTSMGGLTWQIKRTPNGNVAAMFSIPTAPTRILTTSQPAARTLNGDINTVVIRYMSVPDLGSGFPAVYSLVTATDNASIAKHGRKETYLDLSSAGLITAGTAQSVGAFVLQRYQRASFAGPFTARYGELLTTGGQPVDLACFWHGQEGPMVVRLMVADQAYGGEVQPGPVSFLVGRYEYDEDAGTATITPFQSADEDFAGLLAARAGHVHGRQVKTWGSRHALIWAYKGSEKWHVRRARFGRHHTG